jgi:Uma2 family endonuclease
VTATKQPDIHEGLYERSQRRPLSAEDLQTLPDDGNRYEIIEGQLIGSPSPSYRHQRASLKLGNALDTFLTDTGVGQAVAAPMDVYLSENDVVQPDLLVELNEHVDIIQERGAMGAPDLVIEILSPSSYANDSLRKSKLYEQHGVREYWIVNLENQMVSVQTLDGDRFAITGGYSRDDILTSAVLEGFDLALSALVPEKAHESTQETTEEPQPANDE